MGLRDTKEGVLVPVCEVAACGGERCWACSQHPGERLGVWQEGASRGGDRVCAVVRERG